jgi:hypothetical protein
VGGYASPEFADIDGDGDYDLFVGREPTGTTTDPGDIFFYENVGTPQVAQWNLITKNYISLDVGYTASSAIVDINADGDQDLFIQHSGDYLSYYENGGTANFPFYHWVTDQYQDISVNDASPRFGDLDDDNDPDLLMGEAAIPGPPGIYLYQNQGTPQSANFNLVTTNFIPDIFTQSSVRNSLALADIDNDNDLDLFTCNHDRHYNFFENVGTPFNPIYELVSNNWQNIYNSSMPNTPLNSAFYDIDSDGDLDLFLTNLSDLTYFYRNVGTPQNAVMVLETDRFLTECGCQYFHEFDIYDIDNDGDGDFLLSSYDGGMYFFRNVTGEPPSVPPQQETPSHEPFLFLGPNPANPITWITYQLPYPQKAELAVYNLLGQKVATLASGLQMPGRKTVTWNAAAYPSGVYWILLQSDQINDVKKVVVVK